MTQENNTNDVKKPIKINYTQEQVEEDKAYDAEVDQLTDKILTNANTTRTLKNIKSTLANHIRTKYKKANGELKKIVEGMLKINGLDDDRFDPLKMEQQFYTAQTNDVSIDDNANKLEKNQKALQIELSMPFAKLSGYEAHYRVMCEIFDKKTAKYLSGEMLDGSLSMHDATGIKMPYCYCMDASKLITNGRQFGAVHSEPMKHIGSYIQACTDTVKDLSANLMGAVAVGTLFMDVAHLAIYYERIPLSEIKTNKKVRKIFAQNFQQLIHTLNHQVKNATESVFSNLSVFDYQKFIALLDANNYEKYFPIKLKALLDNNIADEDNYKGVSLEQWKDFVIDYIMTVQEIYLDVFDKGDPLKDGLQFPFPVTTVNLSVDQIPNLEKKEMEKVIQVMHKEDGKKNRLAEYVINKDIKKYNIYASEGTKAASCCRLLSDAQSFAGSINSFGGSQITLGSARVVTINFERIALEADTYENFKAILKDRVQSVAKILKAHRFLIMKLEKLGYQPFITNGWINFNRMFGTTGCIGYVEADEICKKKFGNPEFDYMKDFLGELNKNCKETYAEVDKEGKKVYNFSWNIEGVPGESAAVRLPKADKLIYPDAKVPHLLANQWVSLWKNSTVREKMKRDGEIQRLMTGGSIVHIQCDSDTTPSQNRWLIEEAIANGCGHFAVNGSYTFDPKCGKKSNGFLDACIHCGNKIILHFSRIIGYFVRVQNAGKDRREHDFYDRKFTTLEK